MILNAKYQKTKHNIKFLHLLSQCLCCASHTFLCGPQQSIGSWKDLASPSIRQNGKQHANAPTRSCAMKKRRPWIALGATSRTLGKTCAPMLALVLLYPTVSSGISMSRAWLRVCSISTVLHVPVRHDRTQETCAGSCLSSWSYACVTYEQIAH